jgi:hypothetical protein
MVFRFPSDIRIWISLILLGSALAACERHPASQIEEQASPSTKPETKKAGNASTNPSTTPKTYFPQNS